MRVIVVVKASKESEAGQMPSEQLLTAMGKYNEQLVNAGIMLAGEGLHPSSKGKRVKFSGDWLKRAPFDGGTEVEIRPLFEADDFGKELTPELRAQEERLRKQIGSTR